MLKRPYKVEITIFADIRTSHCVTQSVSLNIKNSLLLLESW